MNDRPTSLYHARDNFLRQKYGAPDGKLELEPKSTAPTMLQRDSTPSPSIHSTKYEQALRAKYNLPHGLILENGNPKEATVTVADLEHQRNKEEQRKMKFSFGSTTWKDEPMTIFFDLKI